MTVTELLSPAGNLEKLKVASLYGADAVYCGGQQFGLRAASDNFSLQELEEGIVFAHVHGTKVYVVLNAFLHDSDLNELPGFVEDIESLGVDAVIVSDSGVVEVVKNRSKLPIHLSTQASCLNRYSAQLWKKHGVSRVVLGREVSIQEAAEIKKSTGLEVEIFIHGSMCMAYSGNCVISNYTQGRDSNRGGCAHSCRFEYSLDSQDYEKKNAYFMSSKDLQGIRFLKDCVDLGIDSLKVEGRMKTHHYVGTISKVYSEALQFYREHGHFLSEQMLHWESELAKVSGRDGGAWNMTAEAAGDSIFNKRETNEESHNLAGVVQQVFDNEIVIEVRKAFDRHDKLELIPFKGDIQNLSLSRILSLNGLDIERTNPGTLVRIPFSGTAAAMNIIRIENRL